jgi:putative ABC transport system permease protein
MFFWREIFRGVLDSVKTNRIRFLLTLSGVIVGAASMVLLSGLLAGGKEALLGASRGASEQDLIEVKDRDVPVKDAHKTTRPIGSGDVSTLDDSVLIGDAKVVGMRQWRVVATWKTKDKRIGLVGTRRDSLDLYHLKLEKGRFFSEEDVQERRRVAVVGHKIWVELFDEADSLEGLEIQTSGARFAVIGVLAKKPQMEGGDGPRQWDNRALLPDTTFEATLPQTIAERRTLDRIFVRLADVRALADRIGAVRGVVKSTLLRRHYGVTNFRISGEDGGEGADNIILMVISLLIMGTAVVSLIVGGINVMNIMLVSITERTREIGVRRAVGAPRSLIMWQFLAESTVTAALGGVFGVIIGAGLTFLASVILTHITGAWTYHLVPWAPGLALGTAMFVGATFGLYPAWRASRLDPVEALRFE